MSLPKKSWSSCVAGPVHVARVDEGLRGMSRRSCQSALDKSNRSVEGVPFDEMAVVRALTELAPSEEDRQSSEKAQDEWATLADEMGAYLDRIAPRKKP
jgi:hypothetical protein